MVGVNIPAETNIVTKDESNSDNKINEGSKQWSYENKSSP